MEPVTPGEFADKWSAVLDVLKDKSPGVHGILSQGRLLGVDAGSAVIEVNPQRTPLSPECDAVVSATAAEALPALLD